MATLPGRPEVQPSDILPSSGSPGGTLSVEDRVRYWENQYRKGAMAASRDGDSGTAGFFQSRADFLRNVILGEPHATIAETHLHDYSDASYEVENIELDARRELRGHVDDTAECVHCGEDGIPMEALRQHYLAWHQEDDVSWRPW